MNFIETYFIKDLTLCDDIIEYFKNLPPNKKFDGRIGIRNSRIDHSKKQSIITDLTRLIELCGNPDPMKRASIEQIGKEY